jgi:hypothetical protein
MRETRQPIIRRVLSSGPSGVFAIRRSLRAALPYMFCIAQALSLRHMDVHRSPRELGALMLHVRAGPGRRDGSVILPTPRAIGARYRRRMQRRFAYRPPTRRRLPIKRGFRSSTCTLPRARFPTASLRERSAMRSMHWKPTQASRAVALPNRSRARFALG